MRISEHVLETYADLSPVARRLINFVQTRPAAARSPRSSPAVVDGVGAYRYPLHCWPTLIGTEKLRQIERAVVGVAGLIKSIPERIFANDAKRLAEYFGFNDEGLAAVFLTPPTGLAEALARGDFIDTTEGFRCLEMNMTAHIGGVETGLWESAGRSHPAAKVFFDQERLDLYFRDPLKELLSQIIEDARRSPVSRDGRVDIAIVVDLQSLGLIQELEPHLNASYSRTLDLLGRPFEGDLRVVCQPGRFTAVRGQLHHDGRRVHVLVNHSESAVSKEIFRCFMAGHLLLYNGPLANLLSHKACLSLLSEHEESDLFDADERLIIRDHVPWSRKLAPTATTYRGERWSLVDLLEKRREEFVLKEGMGARGEAVYVGRHMAAAEWKRRLDDALRQGHWVAQVFLVSRPHLFPSDAGSWCVHDVVWGLFCFGCRYGGGFLRMMPSGDSESGGVINSARGATEGLVYEV